MWRIMLGNSLGYPLKYCKAFSGLVLTLIAGVSLYAQVNPKAEDLYQRTCYQESLRLLDQKSSDPDVQNLIGRDYFMMGDFKKAIDNFQQAFDAAPTSDNAMWLGRTWGRRAETSNPFFAPSYASKARQWLEKATELDPKNSDALADLFDYYLEAPGFLGGGYDKAQAVARQISAVDPAEGYFSRAKLAEKKNEYDAAEAQLRRAVEVAPREVGHVIALAKFLAKQGRSEESDAVFAKAERLAPQSPKVWYARADTLIKQKRNLSEARQLLEKYLQSSSLTPDDPSKSTAQKLLRQVETGA